MIEYISWQFSFYFYFFPILHFTLLIFLGILMSVKLCHCGNSHSETSRSNYIGIVTVKFTMCTFLVQYIKSRKVPYY